MIPVSWTTDHPSGGGGGEAGEGQEIRVARTREGLARELERLRAGGRRVALVPTMGYLHQGHLALLDRARALADEVVLSIFVNPLQFGPGEDLERYPRSLDRDLELASSRGASLAFTPSVADMYPDGEPRVRVDPGPGGTILCGATRPGHFQGVLTVVARLFGLIRPEVAVFGRKDAQQAALIRAMVRDLEMGVEVVVAPLVREPDGLAMSSRNAYLTPEERALAPRLFEALQGADQAFRSGQTEAAELEREVRQRLGALPGPDRLELEYVQVVDAAQVEPTRSAQPGDLVVAAARLGATRLIDNVLLGADTPDPRRPLMGEGP